MKLPYYFVAILACTVVRVGALDLQTDPTSMLLKQSIARADSLETIQQLWEPIVTTNQRSTSDIAAKALAYAQEQKTYREHAIHALGERRYNAQQIGKGILYTALGIWCAGTATRILYVLSMRSANVDPLNNSIDMILLLPLFCYAYCSSNCYYSERYNEWFLSYYPKKDTGYYDVNDNTYKIIIRTSLFLSLSFPYWLFSGHKNITKGLTYKKRLETEIAHLDAAIAFFQSHICHDTLMQISEEIPTHSNI